MEGIDMEKIDKNSLVYRFEHTCEYCGEVFEYEARDEDTALIAEVPLTMECPECWKELTFIVHKDGTTSPTKGE